jgi:hypothetical protein
VGGEDSLEDSIMGILGTYRESATIVNRTIGAGKYERKLTVRYDGEDMELKPGENANFPKEAIPFAIKQNIVMGSRNATDPRQFISMVGVVGSRLYPCDPIPEEVLEAASKKLEIHDRNGEFWGEPLPNKVKLLKRTGHSPFDALENVGTSMDIAPANVRGVE